MESAATTYKKTTRGDMPRHGPLHVSPKHEKYREVHHSLSCHDCRYFFTVFRFVETCAGMMQAVHSLFALMSVERIRYLPRSHPVDDAGLDPSVLLNPSNAFGFDHTVGLISKFCLKLHFKSL